MSMKDRSRRRRTVIGLVGGGIGVAVLAGVMALRPTAVESAGAREQPVKSLGSVASLGTVSVASTELREWLAGLTPAWRNALAEKAELRDQWLKERLAEKALVAEAKAKGWEQNKQVHAAIAAATEQILLRSYLDAVSRPPQEYPSPQELTAAYEQAKSRLQIPARYRLRQIFLAATAEDMPSLNSAGTLANQLVKDARAENADFADLARRYSQDAQTVMQGGDLGELSLQQLLPEARSAVSALKAGEVSAAIQSASGFHIIKLESVTPARTATENEVVPQLRSALRQQRQAQLAQRYLQNMVGTATLNIDGAALSDIMTSPCTMEDLC